MKGDHVVIGTFRGGKRTAPLVISFNSKATVADAHSGKDRTSGLLEFYFPAACAAITFSIWSFTASRLKLAPFCIGGNSIAVWASLATCCWT